MRERLEGRRNVIVGVFILCALVLVAKTAQLQLFDATYREKAEATTIDPQTQYPSRGILYDRQGKLLVYNDPIYDLLVVYDRLDPNMDTAKFCALLGIDRSAFEANMDKDWSSSRYSKSVPFIFLKKIPAEYFARFQESMHEFPGFTFVLRNVRGYPHEYAAHVLGYISEVNPRQIEEGGGNYEAGDYAGTSGLESYYEPYLKGEKGVSYVLKDNLGRRVGPLNRGLLDSVAVSGEDIMVSLDLDLQAYAEKLLENKKGSLIAIEPATGEILAMISAPSYDPNLLTVDRSRGEAFRTLLQDSVRNPFFNRTVMAQYPPGSTIKPLWSLIALQQGVIDPRDRIVCNGGYYYKGHFWGCHSGGGVHNVRSAIQYSCNTYFYTTYRKMIEMHGFYNPGEGLADINTYLHDFGLGSPLGVDIPNEQGGRIPDDEYYKKLYDSDGGKWYSTYIISNGIGQGEMEFTTIQMANLAAIIANRGHYYTPHLIKGFIKSNRPIPEKYRQMHSVNIDEAHFDPVLDGMEGAVSAGTAGLARIPGIAVCGKTGTSENPHGEDHSVFFAFAPRENPKIAIAVYLENAGWGGSYAAPIASLVMEKYINGKIDTTRKWVEKRMLEADLIKKEQTSG